LLRARLFPATTTDPKTTATFRVLETFQMLNFSANVNGYDFLNAIYRRTDNITTSALPVCARSKSRYSGSQLP
jgi:hypothetical protein